MNAAVDKTPTHGAGGKDVDKAKAALSQLLTPEHLPRLFTRYMSIARESELPMTNIETQFDAVKKGEEYHKIIMMAIVDHVQHHLRRKDEELAVVTNLFPRMFKKGVGKWGTATMYYSRARALTKYISLRSISRWAVRWPRESQGRIDCRDTRPARAVSRAAIA